MATFDPTAPEVWYPIPRFPGHEISSRFRVRSWLLGGRPGRLRAEPHIMAVQMKRYPQVIARRDDGVIAPIYLHHVVAELAIGPCPEGLQVLHKDDDKRNLDPGNLYFGTPKQNALDRIKNGRTRDAKGEANSNAILTEPLVRRILALKASGVGRREISQQTGVPVRTVDGITSRRRWGHVDFSPSVMCESSGTMNLAESSSSIPR